MALPILKTLEDCADFHLTVSPYLYQLNDLPRQIIEAGLSLDQWKDLYISTNPLISAFAFSVFISPIFLIVSEVNKNYSQVDRCWSILPTVYNAHYVLYAHLVGLPTERLDTLGTFSAIWSVRLTYNYWRKGGYSIGSEDYRWEIVRKNVHPALFFIFNILFISLAQSLLLFMITNPTYIILLISKFTGQGNGIVDIVFSRLLVGLVLLEFFADGQQWAFQQAKSAYKKTGKVPPGYTKEDLDRGFIVTGLFSWSRHPNFAAEQAIWVGLYQWGSNSTGTLVNWTIIGALAYLILFQASTWLTELISAGKYPEYAEYQRRVGKFLPKLGGLG